MIKYNSYNFYFIYRKVFGCHTSFVESLCADVLILSDGKVYSLKGLTDEEIDILMQESLDNERNVLLEKIRGREFTLSSKTG